MIGRRGFFGLLAGAIGLTVFGKRAQSLPSGIALVDEPTTVGIWNLTRSTLPGYPESLARYAKPATFDKAEYIRLCETEARRLGLRTLWGLNG